MSISTNCASVGSPYALVIASAEGVALAAILASGGPGSTFLGSGCIIDVSLTGSVSIVLDNLPGVGAGSGTLHATHTFGTTGHSFLQTLIKDSTAGLITTNALELTIVPGA